MGIKKLPSLSCLLPFLIECMRPSLVICALVFTSLRVVREWRQCFAITAVCVALAGLAIFCAIVKLAAGLVMGDIDVASSN